MMVYIKCEFTFLVIVVVVLVVPSGAHGKKSFPHLIFNPNNFNFTAFKLSMT